MASSITTQGTTDDPLRTDRDRGEAVGAWVERHSESVTGSSPTGDVLTTSWTCSTGMKSKNSKRDPGESNSAFVARHILEYTTAMIEYPPV